MGFKRNNVEEMQKKMEEMAKNGGGSNRETDPNEWKPTFTKEKKASAIIRFLPPTEDSRHTSPFVVAYQHGFRDPKTQKWFIHNCPTTIGKDCPVCKANGEEWSAGNEDLARKRKRKKSYWTNVLVLKDPENPDAEGNVYKYRIGQKIFEKIQQQMKTDELTGKKGYDPCDPYEGANFVLKAKIIKESSGQEYPNYDESSFMDPSAIGDDERIDRIASQIHDIQAIVDPDQFMSYEEMEKEFNKVTNGSAKSAEERAGEEMDGLEEQLGNEEAKAEPSKPQKSISDQQEEDLDSLLGGSDDSDNDSDSQEQSKSDKAPSGDDLDDLDKLLAD